MGTFLGPKYIPYTYKDPLGKRVSENGLKLFEPRAGLINCTTSLL